MGEIARGLGTLIFLQVSYLVWIATRSRRPYFAIADLRREFESPGSDADDRGMEEAFPESSWRQQTMHFDAVEAPLLRRLYRLSHPETLEKDPSQQ